MPNWWDEDVEGDHKIPLPKEGAGRFATPLPTVGGEPVKVPNWWDSDVFAGEEKKLASKDPKLIQANEALKNTSSMQFIRNNLPGASTLQDVINPSLSKGVPVGRHFVPQTPELGKFEEEHPYAAKGLNIAGTAGSMFAPAAGIAGRTATTAGRGGVFLPHFASQSAVNVPTNLADVVAKSIKEQGGMPSTEDLTSAVTRGAAESAVPAGLTGMLGQAARVTPGTTGRMQTGVYDRMKIMKDAGIRPFQHIDPRMQAYMDHIIEMAPKVGPHTRIGTAAHGSVEGMSPATMGHIGDVASTGAGAYLGHKLGGLEMTPWGALLGHTLKGPIGATGSAVGRRMEPFMRHPSTQDVIRALMLQGTNTTNPTNP